MSKFLCFRADIRELNVGDLVEPDGDHYCRLTNRQKFVEDRIRAGHPDGKARRANLIYAGVEMSQAVRYWCLEKQIRNFYALDVDQSDIVHIGDMALYNHAVNNANLTANEIEKLVERYWRPAISADPWLEIVARKAMVARRIYDASQKEAVQVQIYGKVAVPVR